MKLICSALTSLAMAAVLSVAVSAQEPASAPAQTPASAQSAPAAPASAQDAQQVTIVGCVQSEADYRKTQGAGSGGAAGTGIGAGNEFVLMNAAMAPAGGSGAATPTGTAGSARSGAAYELTGSNEGQVSQHVGRRVEITGKLKAAEVGAAGPTGGPTAGAPASKDLKLRELEVVSVKASTGSCS